MFDKNTWLCFYLEASVWYDINHEWVERDDTRWGDVKNEFLGRFRPTKNWKIASAPRDKALESRSVHAAIVIGIQDNPAHLTIALPKILDQRPY